MLWHEFLGLDIDGFLVQRHGLICLTSTAHDTSKIIEIASYVYMNMCQLNSNQPVSTWMLIAKQPSVKGQGLLQLDQRNASVSFLHCIERSIR